MVFDHYSGIKLTVTDIREHALQRLKDRFYAAGIHDFRMAVMDLSEEDSNAAGKEIFDLIIADVPCTGSGTWSRTPERMMLITRDEVMRYTGLQHRIVRNALRYLAPGQYLLYITCSVYREENEDIVGGLVEEGLVQVVKSGMIGGYRHHADTMYAALLTSPVG